MEKYKRQRREIKEKETVKKNKFWIGYKDTLVEDK